MNTLDDRIIFTLTNQAISYNPEGIYTYYLDRVSFGTIEKTLFTGNFYYNGIDIRLNFDCTDLIASDGYVITEDSFNSSGSTRNYIADKYQLRIIMSGTTYTVSAQWVAKVSMYRNKRMNVSDPFFTADYIVLNKVTITTQGYNELKHESTLTPHYPLYNTPISQVSNNCPFGIAFMASASYPSTIPTVFSIGDYKRQGAINTEKYTFSYINKCSAVGEYSGIVPTEDGKFWVNATLSEPRLAIMITVGSSTYQYIRYPQGDNPDADFPYTFVYVNNAKNKVIGDPSIDYTNVDTDNIKYCYFEAPTAENLVYDEEYTSPDIHGYTINATGEVDGNRIVGGYLAAIFDACPKRYYLFWQDRYGSFQCQPFNDYITYSETYNKTEVQDYQNRRRNVNVQIQSNWKLNSGWIDEDLYPFYESIYTSQILFLFDSKENRRYTVMVSGNYEEKTYRNQKKLINMQLELEENKKQSIIY